MDNLVNDEKINLKDVKPDKNLRILTGDRPTGKMHIGHYFGSLKSRIELQDKFQTFIEVADVQALTDNFNNPDKVKQSVSQIVMDELAVGLDPNKVTFFISFNICSEAFQQTVAARAFLILTKYNCRVTRASWSESHERPA